MKYYVKLKESINDMDQVKISIDYSLGGYNNMTGQFNHRGYYLHFTPVKVNQFDTYSSEMTQLFHPKSYKMCICIVNRKSQKKQDELEAILKDNYRKMAELYEEDDKKLYQFVQLLYLDKGNDKKS